MMAMSKFAKQISQSARRNARFNENGTIDCDINHPRFGWIPFTADPNDVEEHGRAIHADLVANGNPAPFVPTPQGGPPE